MTLTEKHKRMKTLAISYGAQLARGDHFGKLMKRLDGQKTISSRIVEEYMEEIIDRQKEIAHFLGKISKEF